MQFATDKVPVGKLWVSAVNMIWRVPLVAEKAEGFVGSPVLNTDILKPSIALKISTQQVISRGGVKIM